MPRWLRLTLIIVASVFGTLLLAALVLPLVWPVPPLEGTVDPATLLFDDSAFTDAAGVDLHYREVGDTAATQNVIFLHGFGASTFSWRDQLEFFGDRGYALAFDRPAFGFTERPMPGDWSGESPYSVESNARQLIALMDARGIDKAVLVAHSAGAAVAVTVAAQYPDRVEALVLEAPALAQARAVPGWVSALLRSPQARRVGPLFARRLAGDNADEFIRSAYADPSVATTDVIAGYRAPLRVANWDRALWELVAAPRTRSTLDLLDRVNVPTVVMAGTKDTFVPYADSISVARGITGARFETFRGLGHLPHEEAPDEFNARLTEFLDGLPSACNS